MAVAFTDGSNFCGACGATIGMAMYGTAENTCCNFYRAGKLEQSIPFSCFAKLMILTRFLQKFDGSDRKSG